ncbi:MAG: putative toxin-antitoxin system toxin component, PIN family [Georgfuchsia sp.]
MIRRGLDGTAARVVFDTNVLLSLWVFADSKFAPLREPIDRGEWVALTDEHCLAEFKRVLGYGQFKLSAERQAQILSDYSTTARASHPRKTFPVALPRCSDRDDQKFLELASNAGAGWLVTADKALLKMARRNKLAGLFHIVTPDAVLAGLTAVDLA